LVAVVAVAAAVKSLQLQLKDVSERSVRCAAAAQLQSERVPWGIAARFIPFAPFLSSLSLSLSLLYLQSGRHREKIV